MRQRARVGRPVLVDLFISASDDDGKPIGEAEASDELKEIDDDIKRTFRLHSVRPSFKAMGNHPADLAASSSATSGHDRLIMV